jgi:hypothetical protein
VIRSELDFRIKGFALLDQAIFFATTTVMSSYCSRRPNLTTWSTIALAIRGARKALPLQRYRSSMRCTVCGNLLHFLRRSSLRRATGRETISGGLGEVAVHRLTKL